MSEFIGARISLISRSDIRYVGTLHQIDSEHSTVGLENVTNHGTEGRCADPANEVDGTEEIYDYIVFRGSDVKDLRMEPPETTPKQPPPQPSFPNDPAIINAQRPPGYPPAQQQFPYQPNGRPGQPGQPGPQPGQPGQPPFPPPTFPQGFYPHPSQMPPGGRFYGQPPYMGAAFPGGPPGPAFPPGAFPYGLPTPFPGQAPPPQNQQQPPGGDGRNRAGTQTGVPTGPASSAVPTAAKVELPTGALDNKEKTAESKTTAQQPPPPPLESKPDVATALAQPTAVPTQPTGPRNPAGRGRGGQRARGGFGSSQPGHTQPGTTITTTTTTIIPTAPAAAAAAAPLPTAAPQQPATESPGLADLERKVQAMKLKQATGTASSIRPNNSNNNNINTGPMPYRGRGRGRGVVAHQPRKVEVPTTDYDFESANARFAKGADGEEATPTTPDAGEGSAEGRKPSIDQEAKPTILPPVDGYYNKGKSFFDNISCENKERAEAKETGGDNRPNPHRRSEEVKKNIETFGQGSVDSGYNRRGGWRGGRGGRGRGNYRGRGRGGGPSQPVKASS
ncbi:hypothetical protein TWF696_009334 [Orbilia brochopaga]|uniref:Uncharacterized protein n=1 Tax=Orbilia brochopaga TaxID=3140254 RepID=A0AAV9UF07_9PEZI